MLAAGLLARTGATTVGLSIGFVAYEQTASAFTLAVVAASFGVAFAASSLISGHVLIRVGLRAMLVGALASQFAGALAIASVTSTAGADVTWLIIFSVVAGLASAFIFVGSQMLLHGVAPGEHLQRVVSLDARHPTGVPDCHVLLPAAAGCCRGARGPPERSATGPSTSPPRSSSVLRPAPDPALGAPDGCARRAHRLPTRADDAGRHRVPEPGRRRPPRDPGGVRRGGARSGRSWSSSD
jgi:hypothetical protein